MNELITALCYGSLSGFVYGLSFVETQKRAFYWRTRNTVLINFCRILILAVGLHSLLQSTKTDLTLVFVSFITVFWLVVIYKKVDPHDGTRSR